MSKILETISVISRVLGTFPQAFLLGQLPKLQLPKCAISQMCNFPRGNFPKVRLGPLRRRRLQWEAERRGYNRLLGWALWLGQTWEVAAWEIARLGSFYLGKYPWEVATWEKYFGKVPNVISWFTKVLLKTLYHQEWLSMKNWLLSIIVSL